METSATWGRKNGCEIIPVVREPKKEVYFRQKINAHDLESLSRLRGTQISSLRASKSALTHTYAQSALAQAVVGPYPGRLTLDSR
jgi:hypothetical protein